LLTLPLRRGLPGSSSTPLFELRSQLLDLCPFRRRRTTHTCSSFTLLLHHQIHSWNRWFPLTLTLYLRQQLFFYRDLWVWLDDPFQAPPALVGVHDDAQQLEITW
jgi:hypothetical protein